MHARYQALIRLNSSRLIKQNSRLPSGPGKQYSFSRESQLRSLSGWSVRSWKLGHFNLGLVLLLIVSVSVEIGFVGLSKLGHWVFSFFRHEDLGEELTVDGVCPESSCLDLFMEEVI